ncbi:extracellular solute-binding protein [Lipingzhangella sp. LS1_29]|uniref:Extracellular solute-binding protein n=1 Tax=Lipingzhangella rawalii TaxID=2055835 RepID=A0ABU2HB53_9ACTN|nr:extracellular solute-binding protein [Lipingzhangella rawalii]MDS1272511.1 extracellular solute-binding protein [Lipingzhangella rawalii]
MKRRARPTMFMAVTCSGALLAVTACNADGDGADAADAELVVETFGNFGYSELIEEFEDDTGITVEERVHGELADWNEVLQQNLAAGSGLGDVVAVEEGIILDVMESADAFHDLYDYGAGEMEDHFLPWKWELGHTPDDELLGLGTDIGSMAVCYRTDHFEDAGLPTERDEVSALWDDWEDFVDVGIEFQESDVDAHFVDTVTEYVNAISRQHGDFIFFDDNEQLYIEESDAVAHSWDIAESMIEEELTAELAMWSDDWNAAIQAGTFATMPCPAWMLGHIEEHAGPDAEGLWDVAEVPGDGGNWGGSWLAVPEETEYPEEATELAMFLTSEEGHLGAFQEANTLPSSPSTLESDEVLSEVNPYFNDAPVGEIFGEGAMDLEPVYLGLGHFPVQEAAGDQLEAWQTGQIDRDEAWEAAVEEAERAL